MWRVPCNSNHKIARCGRPATCTQDTNGQIWPSYSFYEKRNFIELFISCTDPYLLIRKLEKCQLKIRSGDECVYLMEIYIPPGFSSYRQRHQWQTTSLDIQSKLLWSAEGFRPLPRRFDCGPAGPLAPQRCCRYTQECLIAACPL